MNIELLLITFKALNNVPPCYNSNLLHIQTPNRRLRSSSHFQIQFLHQIGDRDFSVCDPNLWNFLPSYIKRSSSVSTFKLTLRTYLFKQSFIS